MVRAAAFFQGHISTIASPPIRMDCLSRIWNPIKSENLATEKIDVATYILLLREHVFGVNDFPL